MNPIDAAFLNLREALAPAEPPYAEATEVPRRLDGLLHRAAELTWPDLVNELVDLAAGRFHGVGELMLQSAARGQKRIALTSCRPGEGRTTVALALGRWFAERHRGRRLLLVDADVERGDLSRRVGLSGPGAREFASSAAAGPFEIAAVPPGLSLLGAGALTGSGAEPAQAWESLAELLWPHFDLILVDTGAALSDGFCVRDAQRLAEAVLWVRDPRRTSLSELCEAQRQIHVASLGVIENRVARERVTLDSAARRHRVDPAGEFHVHVNRLPSDGVIKDV